CQTRLLCNLTQQSCQRSVAFTLHQPQQHGHEVLILGLGKQRAEPLSKMLQGFIQTYNRNRHGSPPWSQGLFITFLIPHGALSCYPFEKCKHRDYPRSPRAWVFLSTACWYD